MMKSTNDEELVARLDAAAALEREELAQASEVSAVAGEEVVGDFFERTYSPAQSPTPLFSMSSRRRILLVAASLVALAVAGRLWFAAENLPREEVLLGGSQLECVQPTGEVSNFDAFHWDGSLPPGGRYEITIWKESEGVRGELLAGPRKLAEPQWNPTTEQVQEFGQEIRWRVRILDATSTEVDQAVVRAWHSH